MADGSIKIKINFDGSGAEKSVENLIKMTEDTVNRLNKQTKKLKLDYDAKGAKEKVKQLNREIAESEKGIQQAKSEYEKSIASQISALDKQIEKANQGYEKLKQSSEFKSATVAVDNAQQLRDELLGTATTQEQINNIQAVYNRQIDELNQKYSSVIQKATEYENVISKATSQKTLLQTAPEQTKAYSAYQSKKAGYEENINSAKGGIGNIAKESEAAGGKASKLVKAFDFVNKGANLAKNAVKGIGNGIGTAVNGAKKLVTAVGSKLVSGLKKGISHFRNMGKGADSVVKKVKKMALAMLGMRGIMGGIRQIVSSAMSNNEELQNSLSAAKGVLGEAITPIISVLVSGLQTAVTLADRLYQLFTGTSLIAAYNAKQAQKEAKAKEETAKREAKQLANFDVANKLEDNNASSNSSGGSDSQQFKTANLSSGITKMLSDLKNAFLNGDYEGMGTILANGLNSVISKANNLDWDGIQKKVEKYSKGFASAINGFTKDFDWSGAGKLLGNGLNTITTAVSSFVDGVDWQEIGAGFSTGLNGLVDKIDTTKLGKTLTAKFKVITETVYGFFNGNGKDKKGFNFANLGTKVGETINAGLKNIDMKKIGSNITSAISGLGETIYNAVKTINWNHGKDSVVGKIEDFIKGLDWKTTFTNIFKSLGATLGGLGSVIIQLIKDAFDNIYNKYFKKELENCGGDIVKGIFNGILNFLADIGNWIGENILIPFIQGFKDTFDIHSPSKKPEIVELGKNIIMGVFNGITDWLTNIGSWLKTNVFDKITQAWNGMKELTLSIGAKIKDSFNSAKEKWDNFKDKLQTLTIQTVRTEFDKLRTSWDNFKNRTAKATAETAQKKFDELKKSWDNFKSKSATLTANLKDNVSSKIQMIINSLNKLLGKFKNAGLSVSDFFGDAQESVSSGFSSAGSFVSSGVSKLTSWFKGLFSRKRAVGGIVNNPGRGVPLTAGEAGREAILPLDNNTEWMDMLAMKLANIGTNGGVVQVVIDGKVVAQAVNKANRQTAAMLG